MNNIEVIETHHEMYVLRTTCFANTIGKFFAWGCILTFLVILKQNSWFLIKSFQMQQF